ncbi:MAG: helix-turn-helix domain-containing protein, partial [Aureispira sp.]
MKREELKKGYKSSNSAAYSRRCHMVLLKSEGKTSEEIARIVCTTPQPVNRWVNRYLRLRIKGLETKPGQGRRAILTEKDDKEKVKATVKQERQQLKQVKEE